MICFCKFVEIISNPIKGPTGSKTIALKYMMPLVNVDMGRPGMKECFVGLRCSGWELWELLALWELWVLWEGCGAQGTSNLIPMGSNSLAEFRLPLFLTLCVSLSHSLCDMSQKKGNN